jgi:hypothetical protein
VFEELDAFDASRASEHARFAAMRDHLGASQVLLRGAAVDPAREPEPERAPSIRDEAITPPPPARRAGLRFGAR